MTCFFLGHTSSYESYFFSRRFEYWYLRKIHPFWGGYVKFIRFNSSHENNFRSIKVFFLFFPFLAKFSCFWKKLI